MPEPWHPLRYHAEQSRLWKSTALFNVVAAGRRSGKTEIVGKRKLVLKALRGTSFTPGANFGVAAPTRDQAKRIYWKDLKLLVPKKYVANISESNLIISLTTGDDIYVLGMDRPERVEGTPWDHLCLDEYANMKADAWENHIGPALDDRDGTCDFIGVPEGRNHYFDLWQMAKRRKTRALKKGKQIVWDRFWWKSEDILSPERIQLAKETFDPASYRQEYEASFENFQGRAYYDFHTHTHCVPLEYNPDYPLIFALDFNVAPGVAAVMQEFAKYDMNGNYIEGSGFTGVIGEVYIPRNSNTVVVCNKFCNDFREHRSYIYVYGDSTGGASGTAKVAGSDWELVEKVLYKNFGSDRIEFRVPRENPPEKKRVNSVNSRIQSYSGERRLYVDPEEAPYTVKDFEGVSLLEGGSGEIDKKKDKKLTHLTDAIGYYIAKEFPIEDRPDAVTGYRTQV